jgi:hypothetical protein
VTYLPADLWLDTKKKQKQKQKQTNKQTNKTKKKKTKTKNKKKSAFFVKFKIRRHSPAFWELRFAEIQNSKSALS